MWKRRKRPLDPLAYRDRAELSPIPERSSAGFGS
jgi:hypothetical protein